jgi:hypothetical protein
LLFKSIGGVSLADIGRAHSQIIEWRQRGGRHRNLQA